MYVHTPVMLKEALGALNLEPGKIYVDATLGGGGYSEAILKKIMPSGRLYSFDIDDEAVAASSERLKSYSNWTVIKDSHVNIAKRLSELGIDRLTGGVVFDFGASFHQLTSPERGFSFNSSAPLDMRFDSGADFSAYDVINSYSESELIRIFSEYGEERFSKRIARATVEKRKDKPIRLTSELTDIILSATPRIKSKIHPATRVFQAVRIEVNGELQNIKDTLKNILPFLSSGAIISTVTFHSAEDRIVKNFFRDNSDKKDGGTLKVLTKKPICATEEEIKANPPSRSAKLRYAMKISEVDKK